jgi:predicted aspartyl protease
MVHPREFHTCEYTDLLKENEFLPLVEVSIFAGGSKTKITALADTGCDPDLVITKSFLRSAKLGLTKKITKNPLEVRMADGSGVSADIYEAICEVGAERKTMLIYVMDTPNTDDNNGTQVTPLLGREFFNAYDVLFKGKHRKLVFCHPKE